MTNYERQATRTLEDLRRAASRITGRALSAHEALQFALDALLEIEGAMKSCATTPDSSGPSTEGTTEGSF